MKFATLLRESLEETCLERGKVKKKQESKEAWWDSFFWAEKAGVFLLYNLAGCF